MKTYLDMDEILRHCRRYIGQEYDEPYLVSAVPEEVIRSLPPADVVEVRHERWDLAKDPFGAGYVKCSRCGYKHCPEYYPDGSAIMHLFCPSCGAKMDGGKDDA